jgi:hypothetical protein
VYDEPLDLVKECLAALDRLALGALEGYIDVPYFLLGRVNLRKGVFAV